MTIAWFNCAAGVAGDMVLGSLVDAGADPIEIAHVLSGIDVDDYALTFEGTQRCGVAATRALVAVHDHGDEHHHRPWREIRRILESSSLPDDIRTRSLAVFEHLAVAEADVHAVAPDDIEFHEVGGTDAIVDVVGVCAALSLLGITQIVCSPVALGHGTVDTAHGRLPNPAPAVVRLLSERRIPTVGLDDDSELATPTGVALMAALADSFGSMPAMVPISIGYGAGARDRPGRANVVGVVIGEPVPTPLIPDNGQLVRLLETNVDDVSGEVVGHTVSRLLAAGAHDAWATPIVMKKGRPAFTVHCLCEPAREDAIADILISETGTLGLRGRWMERWPQQRSESTVDFQGHDIRVKVTGDRVKVEFDDAARAAAALGWPVREVIRRVEDSIPRP